jgi:hypothetical protein
MRGPIVSPPPTRPSYDPRRLLDPRHQVRTPTSPSKISKMTSPSPLSHLSDNSQAPPSAAIVSNGSMYGPTSMLEGLYGAEKRQNAPQKRKRVEAIVIDDDDDDEKGKEKSRSVARHIGTGIIGEYMKEGRELGPPSNALPVDLTKGMFMISTGLCTLMDLATNYYSRWGR